MPKMIVSIDGVVVKEVRLSKDRTTLGRRPYNDIVIDNLAVSGEHAVLHLMGGDVYIEDLESTNGTFVNARAIKKQLLADADIIEVGKFRIRYIAASAPNDGVDDVQSVVSVPSGPIPLSSVPTEAAPLDGIAQAASPRIRFLSGPSAGNDSPLQKVVTTIGTPGKAVAAVTRRVQGYWVSPIDAGTLVNGVPLGTAALPLHDGDTIEVGGIRLQFVHH